MLEVFTLGLVVGGYGALVVCGGLFAYAAIGELLGFWPEDILDLRECDIIETPIPTSATIIRLDERRRA